MSDLPTNQPQPCPPPAPPASPTHPAPPVPPVAQPGVIEYQTATPVAPKPKQGYSLHWSGTLCCLVAVAACIAIDATRPDRAGRPAAERAGDAAGQVFAVLLFCGVFSFAAFYIFRRSRLAATLTAAVLAGLIVLGQFATAQRMRAQQAMQSVQTQMTQMQQQFSQQAGQSDISAGAAARLDQAERLAKTMDQASKDLRGGDAAAARLSSVAMAAMTKAARDLQESVAVVAKESPINPAWVQNREDLVRSRKQIEAMQVQIANARKTYDTMPAVLSAEIKKQSLPGAAAQQVLAALTRELTQQRPRFMAIRDIDEELASALLQAQTLLEETWGQWRVQSDRGTVVFDRTSDADRFNALIAQVKKLSEEQISLQRDYLKGVAGQQAK